MRELPRGTVTLLFTDIEGSTKLLQRLGDAYGDALAEHRRILRQAFVAHDGVEVEIQGDSFFVAFRTAQAAVGAAIDAQRQLASTTWAFDGEVRVRMGIHIGTPVATHEGYVGVDVHRAARVMSAGHGGQVLLSGAARDALGGAAPDGTALVDLGEHTLKDIVRPERLFQLSIDGLETRFPPLKAGGRRPNNLPTQPAGLVGRATELDALTDLLRRDVRVVTITGVGGTGKTRLAIAAAAEIVDEFAAGAFFVDLATLSRAEHVVPAIARALRLREVAGESLADTLVDYLHDKEMLLVLDNFEHVIDAAQDVAALLTECGGVTVLATSRAPLRIAWEREYPLPPLDVAPAVTLFVERAQAVRPEFELSGGNVDAVTAICERLDGLPLAIELAGARTRLFTPEALLPRLSQSLELLTQGRRDAATRQHTLAATIEWSYRLLSSEEQSLFARLSVFRGGFTVDAAKGVCGEDIVNDLFGLVEKNLVQHDSSEPHGGRLRMLETIREYAVERFAQRDDADDVRRRHAEHFLALAERAEAARKRTEDEEDWLAAVERDYDNVRGAIEWALRDDPELAAQIVLAVAPFSTTRGMWSEQRSWLDGLLASSDRLARGTLARATRARGWAGTLQNEYDDAIQHLQRARELYREDGDVRGEATANWYLMIAVFGRDHELRRAEELFDAAVALARRLDDATLVSGIRSSMAFIYGESGAYDRARELTLDAREHYVRVGDEHWVHTLANNVGWLALLVGDLDRAEEALDEALSYAQRTGDPFWTGQVITNLGVLALFRGRAEHARDLLIEALELLDPLSEYRITAESLRAFAATMALLGSTEEAARLVGAVERMHRTSRDLVSAVERTVDERYLHDVAAANPDAWERGRAIGLTMDREAAIRYALQMRTVSGAGVRQ